jgi:hypothetical protein
MLLKTLDASCRSLSLTSYKVVSLGTNAGSHAFDEDWGIRFDNLFCQAVPSIESAAVCSTFERFSVVAFNFAWGETTSLNTDISTNRVFKAEVYVDLFVLIKRTTSRMCSRELNVRHSEHRHVFKLSDTNAL